MYSIKVGSAFNAAHQLILDNGVLEPLHYHNWEVIVAVGSDELDKMGTVMDFHFLKAMIDDIIAPFNDKNLRDLPCFANSNTSAEQVAEFVFKSLNDRIIEKNNHLKLLFVEITEQQGCSAVYSGG